MPATIDMKLMRYLNLFEKVSGVRTKHCFVYNNNIVFAVPGNLVFKAIGKQGKNMKKIGEIFRKKIKVIATQEKEHPAQIEKFIADIVSPVTFNKIEIKDNNLTINAGRQSKAALIGRNRQREKELSEILKNFFGIERVRIA